MRNIFQYFRSFWCSKTSKWWSSMRYMVTDTLRWDCRKWNYTDLGVLTWQLCDVEWVTCVSEPSFLRLENWDNNRPYLTGLCDEKSAWHPLMMRTRRVFGILTLCFLILYGCLVWTRLWLQAEGKDSLQIVTLVICIPGKHLLVWSISQFWEHRLSPPKPR